MTPIWCPNSPQKPSVTSDESHYPLSRAFLECGHARPSAGASGQDLRRSQAHWLSEPQGGVAGPAAGAMDSTGSKATVPPVLRNLPRARGGSGRRRADCGQTFPRVVRRRPGRGRTPTGPRCPRPRRFGRGARPPVRLGGQASDGGSLATSMPYLCIAAHQGNGGGLGHHGGLDRAPATFWWDLGPARLRDGTVRPGRHRRRERSADSRVHRPYRPLPGNPSIPQGSGTVGPSCGQGAGCAPCGPLPIQ